jgi:hypothetical protein
MSTPSMWPRKACRAPQGIADRLVITKYLFTIFDKLGIPSTGGQSRRVLAMLLYLRS